MTNRVAIIQSCYIPWRGFFDLVGRCDTLVLFDSAQFAKRHWHNRNRVLTAHGPKWMTIPVTSKGRFSQPINEVEVSAPWAEQHWQTLRHAYARAPHFDAEAAWLRPLYENAATMTHLSEINRAFTAALLDRLALATRLVDDRDLDGTGRKTDRLVSLCSSIGADTYLSGPSARTYLDENAFRAEGIGVEWMSYGPYAPYPQGTADFVEGLSVLDLLFWCGPEATTRLSEVAKAA